MTARSPFASVLPARTCPPPHRGPRPQRPLADRPRLGRRGQDSAMLMKHIENVAGLSAEDQTRAVQRLAVSRGASTGCRASHDDPGRIRKLERPRREDRLRPDAHAAWFPAAQRTVHRGTTSGSASRTRRSRRSFSSPICPISSRMRSGRSRPTSSSGATSAVHHEPRHEDGKPKFRQPALAHSTYAWEGSAIVMWSWL